MTQSWNKTLGLPVWVLAFGFIIFGPLMAMGPRFMPGAIVYATLAMLPLLFMHWQQAKSFFNIRNRVFWLVVAAVVYSVVSAAWSTTPKAWASSIDIAYLSLCGALIAAELTVLPKEAKRIYLWFFALSLLAGFFVLAFEFLFSHPIHRWFNGLNAFDNLSENVTKRMVALFSLVLWPLAAWLERIKSRVWAIGAIGGFLWFALISTSRAASLGMLIGAVVLIAAYYAPKLMRWALIAFIAGSMILVVPVFAVVDQMPAPVKDQLFKSAQYRLKIWQYSAQHVLNKPIFGHGIDSSRGLQTNVGPEGQPYLDPGVQIISHHPHNVFLQIWLDLGLVGALLWGTLLVVLARSIRAFPVDIQPYALGASFCSLGLLCTTYSPLQAWWAAAHIATALMFMLAAQTPKSDGMSGISAGGIGKFFSSFGKTQRNS